MLLLRSRLPLEQALQLPHAFMTQCTHRCESLRAQEEEPPLTAGDFRALVLVLSGFDTRGHVPQLPHLSVEQSAQVCVSVKAPQALPPFAAAFAIVLLRERLPLEHVPQLPQAFS